MKRGKRIDNKNDWAKFTVGYLRLAELAFQEIIEGKYDATENEKFKIEDIYIPALFNLKHAVEIFLKLFNIEFLNKEFFDDSYYSHDIEQLFLVLRKEIGEKRLDKAIEELKKEFPDKKGELTGKNIFDELEKIVEKYLNLTLLKEKIGNDFYIKDVTNTALRYPTNDLNITLNYEKISKKFQKSDAHEPLLDSIKLQAMFWKLYNLIYIERTSQYWKKLSGTRRINST